MPPRTVKNTIADLMTKQRANHSQVEPLRRALAKHSAPISRKCSRIRMQNYSPVTADEVERDARRRSSPCLMERQLSYRKRLAAGNISPLQSLEIKEQRRVQEISHYRTKLIAELAPASVELGRNIS
jgi:hypothetical protein